MQSEQVINEVVAVCVQLGHRDKTSGSYVMNETESLSCLRDLIILLRDDNKGERRGTFVCRRQLGLANIVHNDLIPIVEQHCSENDLLFDRVMRLLLDITNPTLLHFKQKLPKEKAELQLYLELDSYLYSYKQSFGQHFNFWRVLAEHMTRIINLEEEKREVEDGLLLERILIVIRNILHIPIDCDKDLNTEDELNAHDRILIAFNDYGINDVILSMVNSGREKEFCFHLIEIISLMLREQSAEFLSQSVTNCDKISSRNFYERECDRKELNDLRARDEQKYLKLKPSFNRFSGATYSVKNMKSISDRDIIFHKTPSNLKEITFDRNKKVTRKAKNRQPMKDSVSSIHHSTFNVRQFLHKFCSEFLNNYNDFMRSIRDNLLRNNSQENDETYYLWAVQFFTEFNRCNASIKGINLVEETVSVSSFHYLHTQIERCLELIKDQKQDLNLWSKRLHYALKAYRELLFTVASLDLSNDEYLKATIDDIMHKIFYDFEYRSMLLHLFQQYSEIKMSKAFLKDLIETNHIFLKILEYFCKKNEKIIVKEKMRRKINRKSDKDKQKNKAPEKTREEIWNEISETLSDGLQEKLELPIPLENDDVRAYDPASDKTVDEQKMDVMRRIHTFLKEKLCVEAIALYRDARNVWSGDEDNAFGAEDIVAEEELVSLNQILMTDFPEKPIESNQTESNELPQELNTELLDNSVPRTREVEFKFEEGLVKYCQSNIVKAYALLLRSYETNSDQTNHCIVKMMHRIAVDCKMHAMFFQASLFRTFQNILNDPLQKSPAIQELSKFAKFIISKFINVAKTNKKVFVELLFWSSSHVAYVIEEGYDQTAVTNRKTTKAKKGKKRKLDEIFPESDEIAHEFDEFEHELDVIAPEFDEIVPELDEIAPELSEIASEMDEISPELNKISPELNEISPELNEISPELDEISPELDEISPELNKISPELNKISPELDEISPELNEISPELDEISPELNEISPELDEISPELNEISPELDDTAPKLDIRPKSNEIEALS